MQYSTHLLRHLRFTIGQKIREYRTKQKLTIFQLARLTDIPPASLDHYELGRNEINLNELFKLSCVFEVDVKELL